jgi:MYXO-CTERM domain-containing protein
MSLTHSLRAAALAASILTAAGQAAYAQTCASDKDCPQGHACHATTVNVAEPDCPPGAPCTKPDASPGPIVVMSCEPKTCAGDADCGAGMVCFAQTSRACSGGAAVAPCPRDQGCDAGPPVKMEPMCTTTTTKTCMFTWQLPCNTAADCGAGFTCKPSETGSCSGSGGTPTPGMTTPGTMPGTGGGSGSSGGAAPPAQDPKVAPPGDAGAGRPAPPAPVPPPMCTTMVSYPGWCAPTATSCKTDADCPAYWKCDVNPETPVSNGGTTRPGVPLPPPPPDAGSFAPPPRVCVSALAPPQRAGDSKGESGGTPTGPTPTTGNGGGTAGDLPAPPPSAGKADAGAGSTPTKSSGCAVATGGGTPGGLIFATLLGIALVRRRRRR